MAQKTLVLFDGGCGLCTSLVAFLGRRLDSSAVTWIPLQTKQAEELLAEREGPGPGPDSVRVITDAETLHERIHVRSSAVLALVSLLPWPWRALGVLRLVPRPLRDGLYRLVARLRPRNCPVRPGGP